MTYLQTEKTQHDNYIQTLLQKIDMKNETLSRTICQDTTRNIQQFLTNFFLQLPALPIENNPNKNISNNSQTSD